MHRPSENANTLIAPVLTHKAVQIQLKADTARNGPVLFFRSRIFVPCCANIIAVNQFLLARIPILVSPCLFVEIVGFLAPAT